MKLRKTWMRPSRRNLRRFSPRDRKLLLERRTLAGASRWIWKPRQDSLHQYEPGMRPRKELVHFSKSEKRISWWAVVKPLPLARRRSGGGRGWGRGAIQ